ncbi:MAG: DUF1634 domain-containing protein [Ktedonobacteraceae bacterium]|jgi:uncharacterized membrane protein
MKEHYANHLHINPLNRPLSRSGTIRLAKRKVSTVNKYFTAYIIGWILRCGVILSASITLIGLLVILAHTGGLSEQSLQLFPHTLGQVWQGLLALQPQAIIALGLLLLIATPVLSVTAAVIGFALEHDRSYVVIAFIVLATLIASFLLGKAG